MAGTEVTHVAMTGQKIYKYRDGAIKQVEPDGSGVTVDEKGNQKEFAPGGDEEFDNERAANDKKPLDEADENSDAPPKEPMSPKDNFDETVRKETESGNPVKKSGKKKIGAVIEFEDGSILRLLTTGHMVYDRADGSKFQRNPDGTGIEVSIPMSLACLTSPPHLSTPRLYASFCVFINYYYYFTVLDHNRRQKDPGKPQRQHNCTRHVRDRSHSCGANWRENIQIPRRHNKASGC